jgi:hypothetical protein
VHAAITFIVDGITYVFNTVLDVLEQAFDLVQVVFAKVKTFFSDLFEWLGFLFQWDDILRTHRAMAYTAQQFLGFLPLAVGGLQRVIDDGIGTVQSQITHIFDQLVAAVGGASLGGYVQANSPDEPDYTSSNSNNIVLNATLDNAGSASYAGLTSLASGPFDAVTQLIQGLVDAVQGQPAFEQALSYLGQLGGSPQQIFTQLTSALLRAVQGLAQAMLAGVQVVVDAVLRLVQSFMAELTASLNAEWDIPFVTSFYSWLTDGSPLTQLDLLALILAIPGTVLYKAMEGAAPFPDDASVEAFEKSFTAQTLLANSGLGATQAVAVTRKSLRATEARPAGQTLLAIGGFLSFAGYGLCSAALDVQPMTGTHVVDPFVKTMTKVTLGLELVAQALACPWIYGTTPPNCSDSDGAGAVLWIYECLGVVLDAGFAIYEEAFPENNDTYWGIGIAELYGVGHAITTGVVGSKLTRLGLASKLVLLIPECCKFLRLPQITAPTEGSSLVVLAAADGLCIPASGLLSFADFFGSGAKEAPAQSNGASPGPKDAPARPLLIHGAA